MKCQKKNQPLDDFANTIYTDLQQIKAYRQRCDIVVFRTILLFPY